MKNLYEWEDTSIYSQGQKDRTPTCWTLTLEYGIYLRIHRHVYYPPDQWLMSCNTAGIDRRELSKKDFKDAQKEAINILCCVLSDHYESAKIARRRFE